MVETSTRDGAFESADSPPRKDIEALRSAGEAKSDFLASMSHELRTPLSAILGFSDLMRTEPSVDGNVTVPLEWVEHMHLGGEHLVSLINDVLDLAKIEAGRLDLRPAVRRGRPGHGSRERGAADRRAKGDRLVGDRAVDDADCRPRQGPPDALQPAVQRHQVHAGPRLRPHRDLDDALVRGDRGQRHRRRHRARRPRGRLRGVQPGRRPRRPAGGGPAWASR